MLSLVDRIFLIFWRLDCKKLDKDFWEPPEEPAVREYYKSRGRKVAVEMTVAASVTVALAAWGSADCKTSRELAGSIVGALTILGYISIILAGALKQARTGRRLLWPYGYR